MLVIKEIKEYGLAAVVSKYNLKMVQHSELPIFILNYDQIESPKCNPVVMECRGLILEHGSWDIVCCPMKRFFNEGEALEITQQFNWNNFVSYSKEDGSLINVWFYKDQWHISTRGSFGLQECGNSGKSWKELVFPLLPKVMKYDINYTHVFEFCSPYNKIVRMYDKPCLYWLSSNNKNYIVPQDLIDEYYHDYVKEEQVKRPIKYNHKTIDCVKKTLVEMTEKDPSFEGVVLTDNNGLKLKIKSPTYLALHRLRGENDNMFLTKNLVPFVISGETDELLCYFPEVKESLDKVQNVYNDLITKLDTIWLSSHGIEDQKEFALAIKDCPCNWILFQKRKTQKTINEIINDNIDKIVKYIDNELKQ